MIYLLCYTTSLGPRLFARENIRSSNGKLIALCLLRGDSVLDAITKGSVVALLTDSYEPFYLCKVLDFGIAGKDLGNPESHNFVIKGEKYIECRYLDIDTRRKRTKGKIHYKLLDEIIYVHPATVFVPYVNIDSDLSITAEEYQWLCDCN